MMKPNAYYDCKVPAALAIIKRNLDVVPNGGADYPTSKYV
jgi:hypothetical protein